MPEHSVIADVIALKTRISLILGVVVLTLLVLLVMQYRERRMLLWENEALREEVKQSGALLAENERRSNSLAQVPRLEPPNNADFNELMRLRAEVARLLRENTDLKTASRSASQSPPIELAAEIAQHKLKFAETILQKAEELFKARLISQAEFDQARLARDIAEAELRQDVPKIRQLKFELAERRLAAIDTGFHSAAKLIPAPGTSEEYDRAKLERDLAFAELNDNHWEAARIKLEAADAHLRFVEMNEGKGLQREYLQAKLRRDIAASEYAHQAKIGGAR